MSHQYVPDWHDVEIKGTKGKSPYWWAKCHTCGWEAELSANKGFIERDVLRHRQNIAKGILDPRQT